jgi:hemolysin activation/secretion protein
VFRQIIGRTSITGLALLLPGIGGGEAAAQRVLDRVDPTRIEERAPVPQPSTPAPAVVAPAAPRAVVRSEAPVTVGAIVLQGLERLRPSDFADIFETYVGRTLSPPALAGLADAVAERARARGYVFASAGIPPQTLIAGVLRVRVDEGRIDEVRLRGADNRALRAALAPLVGVGPVTMAQVERRLLIAGDLDGSWIGRSQMVCEGTRNILLVDVGTDRINAYVGLSNDGSRPIGPVQADATVRIAHLLADDDALTLTGLVTPFQPSEFAYGRLRYAKRVTPNGLELSATGSYSTTEPGAYFGGRGIEGNSWSGAVAALHPLLRRRGASLWADVSLTVRDVTQDRYDERVRRDRLSVIRAGVYGVSAVLGGSLRASAAVNQGVAAFGHTRRGDPLASRSDADGTFTSFSFAADWAGKLHGRVGARAAVATQIAFEPLLVSEEVGLGGGSFLRAYDYSERSGDRGTMGTAEINYTIADKVGPVTKPLIYAFVDGGRVTNLDRGFGTGTLFSTGFGARVQIGQRMTADAALAIPLSGRRYDTGDASPMIAFRLARSF